MTATPDAGDTPRALLHKSYADWTEADIWAVFASAIAKDAPLPGIEALLAEHRATFSDALAQVRGEHAACRPRYFRAADGRPLVNPLNLEHFLRLLHQFQWRVHEQGAPEPLLDSLFWVMKGRCGINLFYRQKVGAFFFALHALGTVIGYGDFGDFMILTQACTIGHNDGRYPVIGDGLYMSPGSSILGGCRIGRNVHLATGALVIDRDIPDDVVVFGRGRDLTFKENSGQWVRNFFDFELLNITRGINF